MATENKVQTVSITIVRYCITDFCQTFQNLINNYIIPNKQKTLRIRNHVLCCSLVMIGLFYTYPSSYEIHVHVTGYITSRLPIFYLLRCNIYYVRSIYPSFHSLLWKSPWDHQTRHPVNPFWPPSTTVHICLFWKRWLLIYAITPMMFIFFIKTPL